MHTTYNLPLVALSFIVAIAASYTALELSRRVSHADGIGSRRWLTAGSFSMGFGIWTMHFVGMLALSMSLPHSYDIALTGLSLLIAIGASAFAIYIATRSGISLAHIGMSGLLLGAGIVTMHYLGMLAMIMEADVQYDQAMVLASIVIAIVAATAAIWIIFTLISTAKRPSLPLRMLAATIMGGGICGMHYTGMAAASYTPWVATSGDLGGSDKTMQALVIGTAALVILAVTLLVILFDDRLTAERVQREKSVQRAMHLSQILDESTNEIYLFDADNFRFSHVNRGALENLGYSNSELTNMTPMEVSPGLSKQELENLLLPLREGKRKDMLINLMHRRKDGSEYPVRAHLQLHTASQPPLFVGIVNDITSMVDLESQLAQAKKMESIGQLAAGVAHEINTPAQYVGDNTKFVQDAFADLMPLLDRYADLAEAVRGKDSKNEHLQRIDSAVEDADAEYLREQIPLAIEQSLEGISRISGIVRAMKEFSHPGSKFRESTDLNSAIRNTVLVASNEWRYVADVRTELDENLPPVSCYAHEINQVLLNLIVNAAHAIEMGNKGADTGKGTITITTSCDEKMASITITDTGCGIKKEHLDRVFDPFFTTKDVGKGTGQGLAMAYRSIVDMHGGTLTVASEVGRGTTFTIRLSLTGTSADVAEIEGRVA
ncbi:MHYT domain-containing protein [Woeseia oceani]|uniref:histidine kinase n=1 Tax=Woeseia oceani TaxID=1548547 RepID=A0A193LDH2_9GAMM|nr:hypothetical protein BA177_04245 [Woeseia oceani]